MIGTKKEDSTRSYLRFPDNIESYFLGPQIGKGAFGQVYQASLSRAGNRSNNNVKFAIKIIDKQLVMTSELVQRVKNEVSIHSTLDHPNILRLFHFFEDDRNVYLVMELAEQGELYKILKKKVNFGGGPFDEEQVAKYTRDIVSGLVYLHSQGIIHRDLKLSNILLTSDDTAKIADFGLAVRQSNPYNEQKTLCGTPNYLPP
jgi:polo-like kinase 4